MLDESTNAVQKSDNDLKYIPQSTLQIKARKIGKQIWLARNHLLNLQSQRGFWVGELEADISVTAGYIPLLFFMSGTLPATRVQKVVNLIRNKQNKDGSWSIYNGGQGDLNVSIQTYFALKLSGMNSKEPFMEQACHFIRENGGLSKANVFTKIWLALFGQFHWNGTPTIPPEIMLLPHWFYINIYEFASWSRATIVALSVVLTYKPICRIPEYADISELYIEPLGPDRFSLNYSAGGLSWKKFFLRLDSLCKVWEKLPFKPGRSTALRKAEKWILEHQEQDGSWGGIMLPYIYSMIALRCLDYPLTHPVVEKGLKQFDGFIVEDDSTIRLQPATSPVWDTAWTLIALRDSGLPSGHPSIRTAAAWLLNQEIRINGDWRIKNPTAEPGCWAFEFENDIYPDIDDTVEVVRALIQAFPSDEFNNDMTNAVNRGVNWISSMQSKDGGWAAFDPNNNKQFLNHIPFADFMSPLDPTCADVTAHVVELFSEINRKGPFYDRALKYLKSMQEPDGTWCGRWGVNYLYGTSQAVVALCSSKNESYRSCIDLAVQWLEFCQNDDGGWGETCLSYEKPLYKGKGASMPSQTAWVLLALIAAGEIRNPATYKGIEYLVKTQLPDGSWKEDAYTGTGFPRAFYLRYDLYRIYFPLMALSRYRKAIYRSLQSSRKSGGPDERTTA